MLSLGFRVGDYSPPQVDRICLIWGLIKIDPKPYSIYLRGTIGV